MVSHSPKDAGTLQGSEGAKVNAKSKLGSTALELAGHFYPVEGFNLLSISSTKAGMVPVAGPGRVSAKV